jgi:hypothetical protein
MSIDSATTNDTDSFTKKLGIKDPDSASRTYDYLPVRIFLEHLKVSALL